MNGLLLFIIFLLFTFSGSVVLSEDLVTSNINPNNVSGSAAKSPLDGLIVINMSPFSDRDSDAKTGNQAEIAEEKAEPSASNFNLLDEGAYDVSTYAVELKSSRLLNGGSEPVEDKFDLNSLFTQPDSKTKVFFGTLPFLSVPMSNNENEEDQDGGFISSDSISIFWYFRRDF